MQLLTDAPAPRRVPGDTYMYMYQFGAHLGTRSRATLHKDRKGGGLFLFTHLTVERCPFLFIYLFRLSLKIPVWKVHSELKPVWWRRAVLPFLP